MPARPDQELFAVSAYPVAVLGPVAVNHPGATDTRPLSAAKQHALACLVACGQRGLIAADLTLPGSDMPIENTALRMSMVRLRDHLPPGSLPDAVGGRYTLRLAVDEVDLWHLHALANGSAPLDRLHRTQLSQLLGSREPFGGSRPSTLLDLEAHLVRPAQLQLVNRVAAERPELLTGELVEKVTAHAHEQLSNEQLLAVAASCLARAGERRRAIDLLAAGAVELRSAGLDLSRPLRELQQHLLDGDVDFLAALPVSPARARPALPAPLVGRHDIGFVGSREAIQRLVANEPADDSLRVTLVTGPSGSGKSRLCREYLIGAQRRELGVVYAVTSEAGEGAFGALVAALPELAPRLARALDRATDTESRRAETWQAIRDELAEARTTDGLVIIVDDCQWADSYLIEFLASAVRTEPGFAVHLVLSGRDADADHPWTALRWALERGAAPVVEPHRLDEVELADLVRAARPDTDSLLAAGAARRLAAASNGLPGTALLLLAGFDDELITGPSFRDLDTHHALRRLADSLSPAARTVGASASVLDRTVTIDELTAVADLTAAQVLDALDELVRRGLMTERSVLEFDVTSVEARSALLSAVLGARLLGLSARAAELVETDVHRRARLLAHAVPVVSAAVAGEALRRSARLHAAEGLHREAAEAYLAAQHLDPDHGGADDVIALTRSLDLSGAGQRAAADRLAAFDALIATGDHESALRLATSGLPEAEPLEGAPAVIEQLLRVDPDRLPGPDQWLRSTVLARQCALCGRLVEGAAHADQAAALATTPEHELGAAIARRVVLSANTPPTDRLAVLAPLRETARALGPTRWAEFAVLEAVDHYEHGDLDTVRALLDELDALGHDTPLLRRWHSMLLRATLAADDDRLDDAHHLRLDAHRLAVAGGFREADIALVGAEFATAWLLGRPVEIPASAANAITGSATAMALAALTIVTSAAGHADQALQLAETVARNVVASPVSGGCAALAMVCDQLRASSDHALVHDARTLLAARGDSLLMVGAGVVSVGPVARYLAMLATNEVERRFHLLAAQRLAERSGSRLWRTIAARDLDTLPGTPVHAVRAV